MGIFRQTINSIRARKMIVSGEIYKHVCQSQPKMGLDPGVKLARFWDVCVFDLV